MILYKEKKPKNCANGQSLWKLEVKIFLEQLSLDQPLMTENSEVDEVVRKYIIHWLY